ncbi:ABC transporter permease [Natronomonas sp.]|uniref:ABC transporter permease n=1 Tax=Natronomonas sp. TaxID=2184060 RepID=UPI002FC3AB49
MSLARLIVERLALALVTIWAVLSGIFLLFVGTENWYLGTILARVARSPTTDAEDVEAVKQEYLAERGLDGELHELYVDWMANMFTFQWGQSFDHGVDALPMVLSGTARTAAYVLPAILLAVIVGLAVGLFTAMNDGSLSDSTTRTVTYAGMGIPNFWVGAVLLTLSASAAVIYRPVFLTGMSGQPEIAVTEWPALYSYVLPTLLVATTLLAAVASYARAYSKQYYADDITKLVKAKGGGRVTIAKHVVRNAAIPLVSILFTETLALIALSVFVIEAVFAIDGIGSLFYNAIWTQDLPIVMGSAMVFVTLGVVGNLLQDLLNSLLDPRVDTASL